MTYEERIIVVNWILESIGLLCVTVGSALAWGGWESIACVGFALILASRR